MRRTEQLDKLINFLYSEESLHWKGVDAAEIVGFGVVRHKLATSDAELGFSLEYLSTEGYIKLSTDNADFPRYYLTTKGILLKEGGGFKNKRKIQCYKDSLYQFSLAAVIVAGIYYILEIIKFFIGLPSSPAKDSSAGVKHPQIQNTEKIYLPISDTSKIHIVRVDTLKANVLFNSPDKEVNAKGIAIPSSQLTR